MPSLKKRRGAEAADPARSRRRPGAWLAGVLLVALAVCPYLGALRYPLQQDDRTLIDNPWLAREAGLPNVLARDYWFGTRHAGSDLYRPLTVLAMALNLRWAPSRAGFHGTNLVLHALVTLLVWWMLARLRETLDGRPTAAGSRVDAAWAGAALFAVHPLATEAVIFAVGRADLMATGFGLAALAAAMDGRRLPGTWALSACLFALALLSKESAASWLPALLLWSWLRKGAGAPGGRATRAALSWAAVLAGFLLLRASVVGWKPRTPPWVDNPLAPLDPAARFANAVLVHTRYLAKMVFPRDLSVSYEYDQIRVLPLLPWALPAVVAAIAVWFVVARALGRVSRAALFLWAFVPIAFAVTGNFFFPIGTIFAERLAYMPLVGACGLAGLVLCLARAPAWLGPAALTLVLTAGVVRTAERTRDFRDLATLVEATAAASPRAVKALANVGRLRIRQGRPADALDPLERAVAIWPDYPRALGLLGDAHGMLGQTARAESFQRRASAAYELWKADPGQTRPEGRPDARGRAPR